MVDYRPIPDERDVFHEYRSYAFRPEEGVPAYDPDEHERPRATLGSRRGVYETDGADDAEPRCVCRHYWLESRVREECHRTAGLASVATPPEYRRRGYVRQLLARSLAEYRDREIRFSVLWPFSYRFYRQYGWDTCNRIVTHECEPSVLSFATDAVDRDAGSIRRLEADEFRSLTPAYEAHADRYSLSLEREEDWWRYRVFGGHDRDPFVYAYERDGRVRGYLVYTIDGEMGDRTMAVSELVAADHEATLALLSFCHDHGSQVERVRLRVPSGVPLRDLARDPDEIETVVENGPMVRIVDVAATLSALSYPDLDVSTTIAVEDPLAEWNEGVFELAIAAGQADCTRLDGRSNAAADADVRLEIGALSQLVVGFQSAETLERTGRIETAAPEPGDVLSTLFPQTEVYLGDRF
ncbi:GNAT family N-acetyltransferase [Natrinema longum]|uniref:GNAT family N-acetyltransferase n=1 Tax=Natrinema longum TaxID=370324 RepID=A0A8A2UAJ3_9EURY|nr:GNAT family N-acetyltransferase [Natrinema longum]MBZ6493734.1 GNAT family N-acetyltransferase [Natrinema longum]QSW84928.1 GNAT family N-acetyltransferase [Natrinema longum]